ncbi:MAG TPA: S8/S53 family peptidase [Mycobacteriales bacterium]|jgi:hypothetical protein|nr:S8/S53 family peptidase [Mycobacteriales bacterium]
MVSEATSQDVDQIVVALPHRALIQGRLREWGVQVVRAQEAPELGLALLDLRPDEVHVAAAGGTGDTDLDRLLQRLYSDFTAEYHGWVPMFGKNRTVEGVIAKHTIGGGGESVPTAVHPPSWPVHRQQDGTGVVVAVLDTPVAARPQLLGRFVAGADALLPDGRGSSYAPDAGHGTFVSGLVLREAPGATLHIRPVLDEQGTSDSWTVARAIVALNGTGVSVLNLSMGCFTGDNQPPLVLSRALDRLDPEILVIASAGNHGVSDPGRPLWPAALIDVVAVGATRAQGSSVTWSPKPEDNPWLDVLAWGDEVESIYLAGPVDTFNPQTSSGDKQADFRGYASWSGTSFAAARLSGMVAAAQARDGVRRTAGQALHSLLDAAPRASGLPWVR